MIKKHPIFPELRCKQKPSDELGIADKSIFVDGGYIRSFIKNFQRLIDSFREHLETFLENPTYHFFTVNIKYFFNMLQDEIFDKFLDVFSDFIDEQKF